ncbi:N-acetylglucosamine-6-phosphate deacetylase [Ursidibacter maritimus]|uniref:N-acetylglucosamine-6-phosphate deacetylase n=1 Tax=Ursidibacter maritimus TaxID=1331689 RepID=A0A949T061_9PAST|nr:N-acetylglucosamine-6-phosphate deacetylase [Ursidibacter maritimus]KAE9540137.1 N-acetylglucosamine-6-phosphate deacetylase [Ursidibacter maritimus]MBV6523814.1 N-acetylglucosamine-6-phosphate deacetylase [Ursidibacter maritimus]MBV6526324.1 N-acetylglucosamine-6-phosphate deacetylase [Ursidibacter maritimus]MBV6527830.1 N-acetylglucosamine-6-phosphate deacetylase [Ursidibacter maritimus]MBV6529217.1 N-acetylglucosamine-6-phosphate deacetylase [Ursidibacter maritimus]
MSHYALTNCVVYTGNDVLYQHAVIVKDDKIDAIVHQQELPKDLDKIDLKGANLSAGFIDLQLNGCGGVMFNEDISVRTLEIMQETNLKSGTTSYLPTFITSPDEGMKQAVQVMRDYLAKYKNQALGLHLEGPYLSVAKKGVHRPEYIREASGEMIDFLCNNGDVITKLTIAAENGTADHIQKFVDAGIIVSIGHSNATYEQAKQRIEQGISFATHLHNAMSPISSGREGGVVGAVLDSDIYTGIIVDGLHVDWSNVRIAKKAKGDKLVIVTDAVAPAGANIDHFIFVGKKVLYKDGKCIDEFGSLGGAAVTMIESIRNVIQHTDISLEEAIRMCTLYPAKAIHVDDKLGSIEVGKIANLTVFDNQFNVLGTAVNGEWKAH